MMDKQSFSLGLSGSALVLSVYSANMPTVKETADGMDSSNTMTAHIIASSTSAVIAGAVWSVDSKAGMLVAAVAVSHCIALYWARKQ